MEKCESILLRDPSAYKGRWRDAFPGFSELNIELGCGKGRFTVEAAQSKPETLFVAVERAGGYDYRYGACGGKVS